MCLFERSNAGGAHLGLFNTAYNIKEERSFWRKRLRAFGRTIALAIFLVSGQVLIMFGDWVALGLANGIGLGATFVALWRYIARCAQS